MGQMGFRVIEEDILASCVRRQSVMYNKLESEILENLKRQKSRLDEITKSIEQRDMTPDQVREQLQTVQKQMNGIRKASKFWVSKP